MLKVWEGLRSKADKDNDGQVIIKYYIVFEHAMQKGELWAA